MTTRNHLQLLDENDDPVFRNAFAQVFSLRVFFRTSIRPPDYHPQDVLANAIVLTPAGREWRKRLQKAFPALTQAELQLAVFLVFYHQELLVDVVETSVDKIKSTLNSEILGDRIHFPWVYGTLLYDRYFDAWPDQMEELPYDETTKLLADTPQGVFQLRSFLVGPFGLLESGTARSLPPTRQVPLWHCSDPSCGSLHTVRLSAGRCPVAKAVSHVYTELRKLDDQPSEWNRFYADRDGSPDWYEDLHLEDLPWLLANGFSMSELRQLLEVVINRGSTSLRSRFPTGKRFKSLLTGAAKDICQRLDTPQCLQLLLLATDDELAENLESLVEQDTIHIPWTEVRSAMVAPRPRGWFHLACECSGFGVRSRSMRSELPLARLTQLIREAYGSADDVAQLEWSLRLTKGDGVYEKLNRRIHTEAPSKVVTELLLAQPKFLKKAYEFLRYGSFPFPVLPDDEDRVVKKILWKLGFNAPHFPPHQNAFWERLDALLKASRKDTTYREADREAIRSKGVNLFVSVEEILDLSLSFICWALLGDHYGVTKFRWNADEARGFMAKRLDGKGRGSGEPIHYDPSGKNALFPLIQGFALVADVCDAIVKEDPAEYHRSEGDIPAYAERTKLDLFPFEHTALILDVRQRDQERILALLREITSSLESPDICEVRNRVEHKRKDFPSQQEIEDACDTLSKTFAKMETSGVCPLVYSCSSIQSDAFGRRQACLVDYQGRTFKLHHPSQYILARLPNVRQPLVLIPWLHVGESLEIIRFSIQEPSDFTEQWKGYPKRKSRLPASARECGEQPTTGSTLSAECTPLEHN